MKRIVPVLLLVWASLMAVIFYALLFVATVPLYLGFGADAVKSMWEHVS